MLTIAILLGLLSAATSQVHRGRFLEDHEMNFLVKVTAYFEDEGQYYVKDGAGFIVSQKMILTAAHVFVDLTDWEITPLQVEVVAGSKHLDEAPDSGMQTHLVLPERVHVYPGYRNFVTLRTNDRYDVALIALAAPLKLGPMVAVAPLRQPSMVDGQDCRVMGWGESEVLVGDLFGNFREEAVDETKRAMIGKVKMLDPDACEAANEFFHRTHQVCYGCLEGEVCQSAGKGDSGGPVACSHENEWHVVAVHTMSCFDPDEEECTPETPRTGVSIKNAIEQWINFITEQQTDEDRQKQPSYQTKIETTGKEEEGGNINEIFYQID